MKTKSFFSVLLVTAFLSVTLTSCKKDEVAVASVSLDQKTYALAEGGQFVLTPTILPADAANKNVTWESSNAGVATVSGGLVNGISAGTATITVKTVDGGKTDNCVVTVTKDVTGVTIAPSPASVPVGEEITLTASIEPAGASDQTVTWSKGDGEGDVTIAPSGLTCKVTGVTAGNIEVVVTTGNGKTAKCIVTVTSGTVSVESVELDKTAQTLPRGETFTLTATINPAEATNKTVTWSQSGDGEVELEPDGLTCKVTGVAVGTVIITVTTEDGEETATCEVEVITIGADFSESAVKVYDYTGTKMITELYKDSYAARYADMDLEHVLISGRIQMGEPAYFKLSDLKNGVASPQRLITKGAPGVVGGNGGEIHSVARLAHGQVFASNLHTNITAASGSWFRIYNWLDIASPVNAPFGTSIQGTPADCYYQYRSPAPNPEGSGWSENDDGTFSQFVRFGDDMTVDVDESGKGYVFCMGYGMLNVMRITLPIKNWNEPGADPLSVLPDPNEVKFILPGTTPPKAETPTPAGYQTFYKVDGAADADEYLYTAGYEPISLVNSNGVSSYTMTSFSDNFDGCAARIINFNNARYLVTMNDTGLHGEGVIAIYDITDGATTKQALENFDNRSAAGKAPKYTFSMNGDISTSLGLGATSISFAKDGDTLYIIGSADNSGFAIIEFSAME